MADKRDPRMSKREESSWETFLERSQGISTSFLFLGYDIKNTSTLIRGISTIADTYDQYQHHSSNNTVQKTITSQKSLGGTMKRQPSNSRKYKDELKETKKKLK